MTYKQHISDGPIVILKDNETLKNEKITIQTYGSRVGRFIFTGWAPIVKVEGKNTLIEGCWFEFAPGAAIEVA